MQGTIPLASRNQINMTMTLTVLLSEGLGISMTSTDCLALGFWDVHKTSCLITNDDTMSDSIWSLVQYEDAQWCPDTAVCGAFFYHISVGLALILHRHHAQILVDNLQNTVFFHTQLTCNHSNSQLTIAKYHLLYSLNVDLSFACWKLSSPGVIFPFSARLFEPLVPLKNTCASHGVIHIHLIKHFKCSLFIP